MLSEFHINYSICGRNVYEECSDVNNDIGIDVYILNNITCKMYVEYYV